MFGSEKRKAARELRKAAKAEEDRKKLEFIMNVVASYHAPAPPQQFCPHCGAKMVWQYESARPPVFAGAYNPDNGQKRYNILAASKCPNGDYNMLLEWRTDHPERKYWDVVA